MLLVLLFNVMLHLYVTTAVQVKPMVISTSEGACLSQEVRETIFQNIRTAAQAILEDTYLLIFNCGPGTWDRVAYVNMSDPSQQCPSAWEEGNATGIRFCKRPYSEQWDCQGTSYTTGRQYRKVCGRAIGYQIGGTVAFDDSIIFNGTIDSYYVDGVSVTHGVPRNHIWTFAAGSSESTNCPCSGPRDNTFSQASPLFVGDNYYCESGNPYRSIIPEVYTNDPLWDGQQCEGQCCSDGKSPPWFSVDLLNPTNDDIEVRICGYLGDDIGLHLLELYIQEI